MKQITYVDPAVLIPYENNPRDNDASVATVAASIKDFHFQNPIIVDKDMVIIAGHTRLKAALQLGLDRVPVIIADDLTPDQCRAYRLADNKAGESSTWLDAALQEELDALVGSIDMSQYGFYAEQAIEAAGAEMRDINDIGKERAGLLTDKFLVPPFSVFDTRQGYWQERTRMWKGMTNEQGQAREDAKSYEGLSMGGTDNGVSILNPTLCEVALTWYRPLQGNRCFDPFAGDTNFGFVAASLGWDYTGIELRQEQVDFNKRRFEAFGLDNATYICDDGQNVAKHLAPASQDLLFSCPPYYDLEVYSDLPNDASNQPTYEAFLQILDNAFAGAITCLKDDRFAVIVVGDVRDKKGAYRGFVDDVKRIFMSKGMALYNEIILVNAVGTAAFRASSGMRNRKVVKVHQNVLVFYKGDISHIQDSFGPVAVMEAGEDGEQA